MSTTRDTMLLLAGVAIGTVSGFTIANVGNTTHEKPTEIVVAREAPAAPAPGVTLEPAVSQEHAARIEAEKERDALRAELAQVRSASGTVTQATPLAPPRRGGRRDRNAAAQAPPPPPRALATLTTEVDDALARKDATKAVALLSELARSGRQGWPLIEKLATATFEATEEDDANQTWQVRGQLQGLISRMDLGQLALETLLDPAGHSVEFRRLVGESIGSIEPTADQTSQLVTMLRTETDPELASAMLSVLVRSQAVSGQSYYGVIKNAQDPAVRRQFVGWVQDGTPESVAFLSQLAQNDPDPGVQKAARLAVLQANPPVQGYLVTKLVENSQAASLLQEGDLIVSYNGTDVKSEKQLAKLKSSVTGDAPIQVGVWRNGSVVQISMKPGSIGVYGGVVKPASSDTPTPNR